MIRRVILTLVIIYGFLIGFGVSTIITINKALPPADRLEEYIVAGVSKVYDRKGKLIHEFYEEARTIVPLENIPKTLIKTTIVIEDKNFYSHCGIDLWAIARATICNVLNLRTVQGASTITQQLARNLCLTMTKSTLRKIKEIVLAFRIERTYSKDEILELYFNQIYYGNGAYGVEAAAQRYFGKHIEKLTIAECATLISIPKYPEKYNPYSAPEKVVERRNFILSVMAEKGIIAQAEKEKAQKTKLEVVQKSTFKGNYFIEEIRKWATEKYGPELLYMGGLSIYTTLDAELQERAEKVIASGIERVEEKYKYKKEDTLNPLQTALITIDVRTGAILAEVGGREFVKSMFNRAVQALRQPGSAFKPFTWIAALASDKFNAASIVEDAPISIRLITGQIYSPVNYDGEFFGPITLREGIAHSRNLVAVRLIQEIGPEQVVGYARRMGITSTLDPVIALSLGSSSVTLIDIVSAFSTMGNQGIRTIPYMIEKITDKENVLLYRNQPVRQQVLSPQLAYIMTNLLQSVLNEGTGVGARAKGFYYPCAGKTGTTDNYNDAWFIGYTPSLACGVWFGFDQRKRIGRKATSAEVALPTWTDFMISATEALHSPYEEFFVPEGLAWKTICKKCGRVATSSTKETRKEVFIKGTEPTDYCSGIHRKKL
ncbi:MAG: PBP1A family penicillin-binding protein [Candidatus Stahlbacteria bacterium]|nr:PBP1A family penicillin-binding protein [Candidatus Stahlbacteria bacterium]